ncbi:SRPBCC family protein [Sphingomonas crocodyli]|uniref:Glutathione-dependent formaldehyde-activating protein n=1 Tax=Sphingomonas crocodyli TaxID=1979270 RepID=A0A437LY68_9SPHN|nr:SRPBCC family protein [Sphingomonas crocodyli]RVT90273.1 glutathione-dependent formaldehyde-activating protein [Sphingomonas crocodyli]
MRTVETSITIDAPAQTIWAILDELDAYAEWNKVIPRIAGLTTVGQTLSADIAFTGMPPNPFSPTIMRVVGARELRWFTEVPGEHGYRAEHVFKLSPLGPTQTRLDHSESFEGPLTEMLWPMMDGLGRRDYEQMNLDLKERAEQLARARVRLHPALDGRRDEGPRAGRRYLQCHCDTDPVLVQIEGPVEHTHLCGCSQCWKPQGALLALTAVVASDLHSVTANHDKLSIVDTAANIQRYACSGCGVHMIGLVADPNHHFFGLAFLHPELAGDIAAPRIEWAGFISSLISSGTSPRQLAAVRRALTGTGIEIYDMFSPEIMDLIAWHGVKLRSAEAAKSAARQSGRT